MNIWLYSLLTNNINFYDRKWKWLKKYYRDKTRFSFVYVFYILTHFLSLVSCTLRQSDKGIEFLPQTFERFEIPKSMQPDVVSIWYFKLWISLEFCLKHESCTPSGCKDIGIWKFALLTKLSFFQDFCFLVLSSTYSGYLKSTLLSKQIKISPPLSPPPLPQSHLSSFFPPGEYRSPYRCWKGK